jgi:hypothetical protein
MGRLRLTGHTFYLDTTRFSGEVIGNKLTNDISDGGVGNTEKLNNYLITLDGVSRDFPSGIKYSLGVGRQKAGEFDAGDEKIRFAALFGAIRLDSGANIELSVDLLSLRNADGFAEDTDSATFGAGYSDWPFYMGIGYSKRFVKPHDVNEEDRTDRSVEFVYRHGISDLSFIESAYRQINENNIEENAIGIAYIYSFDWLFY